MENDTKEEGKDLSIRHILRLFFKKEDKLDTYGDIGSKIIMIRKMIMLFSLLMMIISIVAFWESVGFM